MSKHRYRETDSAPTDRRKRSLHIPHRTDSTRYRENGVKHLDEKEKRMQNRRWGWVEYMGSKLSQLGPKPRAFLQGLGVEQGDTQSKTFEYV
jgi:hypothetical protein